MVHPPGDKAVTNALLGTLCKYMFQVWMPSFNIDFPLVLPFQVFMAELRSLLQEGSLFKSVAAEVFEVSWIKTISCDSGRHHLCDCRMTYSCFIDIIGSDHLSFLIHVSFQKKIRVISQILPDLRR